VVLSDYQVIVIGGGHAGVEAAWAAANLLGAGDMGRASVALVTLDPSKVGVMSCNPAIGGLAKGQLVREVDALGGLMGLAADATGIQFKVLNTSKGPAVHGPRCQSDKHAYAECVQRFIASRPEIEVVAGSVERLIVENRRITGVEIKAPSGEPITLRSRAVVLTTGTFMRGLMHTGEQKTSGGRFGESAAVGISGALRDLGFELGRLKTGTPPRLKKSTIRWEELPPALGDVRPVAFSDLHRHQASGTRHQKEEERHESSVPSDARCVVPRAFVPALPQVECRQTRTTPETAAIIRANLHRAPMYSGQIESVGPRYCPSIEDKVVRFSERESHGVFLEPESLRDDWIYCNGISTSLPSDVQDAIVRGMPGCENAHIYRYGYAVEYDMVRPHQIHATGMTKLVEGLLLAGQINGTSGYEEAAAQGLVAGVNAGLFALGRGEWVVGRDEAYIGVLMDDLITKTPVEPYRMFTSRAEHRLLLRADNAADRLTPLAEKLGLLSTTELGRARRDVFARRRAELAALDRIVARASVGGVPLARVMLGAEFAFEDLERAWPEVMEGFAKDTAENAAGMVDRGDGEDADVVRGSEISRGALLTAYADRRYEPYLARQRAEIKRQAELEHRRIPEWFDYAACENMRTEAKLALGKFRPGTFGQAGRLEGVTPADLTLLAVLVKRGARAG
jgi:tRNA uridine 5-carboxymethylaminomethyl modification enzyme